jgi:hypothetical protein
MDRFLSKHQQVKEEAMKVQAKKLLSDHYQYEVVEESSNYYIVYGTGGKVAVSKADYEPVREWDDVTGMHEGGAVAQLLRDPGYRLVRHDVYSLHEQSKAYAYLLEKVKR